jgi:hypothetical protein
MEVFPATALVESALLQLVFKKSIKLKISVTDNIFFMVLFFVLILLQKLSLEPTLLSIFYGRIGSNYLVSFFAAF